MASFRIFAKENPTVQVYEYVADHMIEWDLFPYANYNHVEFNPEPVVVPRMYNGRRVLTKFEFRKLFGPVEIRAIDKFASTFENMALPSNVKDDIRTGLLDYEMSGNVNLDEPTTVRGVGMYVQLGLITQARSVEVLNG